MSAHYKAEAREPAGAGTGIGSGPAALFPTGVHQRRMSGPHAAGRAATNLTVLRRAFSWGGLSPPAGHRVPSPPLLRRHHHSSPRPRARKSEQCAVPPGPVVASLSRCCRGAPPPGCHSSRASTAVQQSCHCGRPPPHQTASCPPLPCLVELAIGPRLLASVTIMRSSHTAGAGPGLAPCVASPRARGRLHLSMPSEFATFPWTAHGPCAALEMQNCNATTGQWARPRRVYR